MTAEKDPPTLQIARVVNGMTPLQLDEFAMLIDGLYQSNSFTIFRTHLQVWAGQRVELADRRRRPSS